jgi:NAD(P)-dependent dehydrogenase (short-subunit alcohol dehydrogenase family)
MAKRGEGAIVNLSTIAADYGAPGMSLYGSSKAAINLLTKTWAAEYGPKGLRVNAVSPGPTRLDAIESVIPPARKNPAIQIAFVPGARGERLGVPGEFCTSECETNWYERSLEWREGRSILLRRS